ncbi:Rv3654c family TadE-like protein [Parasphingorhabdus pacifica]
MTIPDERDRGAATALSAVLSVALLSVLWFAAQFGAAVVHRHRAEGAADLAALAVASHAPYGRDLACGRAGWISDGMGVELLECRVHGWHSRVKVRASAPGILSGLLHAEARARAGPVS